MIEKKKQEIPTSVDFFIKLPLYEKVEFDANDEDKILEFLNFRDVFDTYCPECNERSIFKRDILHSQQPYYDTQNVSGIFSREFKCSRNGHHKLYFTFSKTNNTIEKIGQLPSLATLNMYDVQKYSKVLDKKYFHELTKAIGLVSHGIGVGSFVYLRRIFESLINDSYLEAKTNDGWDDEQYSKSKMAEKIDLLKNELPHFLVENKSMYGILSKGIHELSENECLEAFSIVKIAIELILDEKLEKMNKDKKLVEAKKAISSLAGQMK